MEEKQMINPHYLAGFFDGEGSFILRFKEDCRYKSGIQIDIHANMAQKSKEVLEKIQNSLMMGKLYYHKRDCLWHLNIYKIDDLKKFTNIIKEKVIVKDFALKKFAKCVDLIQKKKHLSKKGIKKIKMIWSAPKTEDNSP